MTSGRIAATLLAAALTGCGVTSSTQSTPTPPSPASGTAAAASKLPTSGAAVPGAPVAAATPSPSASSQSAASPVQMTRTAPSTAVFAIRPLLAGGPSGSVTVSTSAGGTRYQVVISGLSPGSGHTVHDHLGR